MWEIQAIPGHTICKYRTHVILVACACLTAKIDETLAVVDLKFVIFSTVRCGGIQRRKYRFKLREGKGRDGKALSENT